MRRQPAIPIKLLRYVAVLTLIICMVGFVADRQPTTAHPAAQLTCGQLVPLVQKSLADNCKGLDRNEICFGYPSITAQFKDQVAAPKFKQAGDIVPISAVKSITTGPLNMQRNEWGLAVLKVQANLPNTSAGQTVTFVVYGNTTLNNAGAAAQPPKPAVACSASTNRATSLSAQPNQQSAKPLPSGTTINVAGRLADSSWLLVEYQDATGWLSARNATLTCDAGTLPVVNADAPAVLSEMGAFYFSTAVASQADCKDVPSGLMIQSPTGSTVTFKANGASLTIGSSVVLRAKPKGAMQVAVLKGKAIVEVGGKEQVVTDGQETSIPLGGDDGLTVEGPPTEPQKIEDTTLSSEEACSVINSVDGGDLCGNGAPGGTSSGEPTQSSDNGSPEVTPAGGDSVSPEVTPEGGNGSPEATPVPDSNGGAGTEG